MLRALAAALFALLFSLLPCAATNNSVSVTPVLQTAAYASGNSMGGLQTVSFFRSTATYDGVLDGVWLASQGGATTAITFYIFDKLPIATTCTDKAAFSMGAVDVDKLAMAPFSLTPSTSTGTTVTTAQIVQAISIRNKDTYPGANLYVCLVAGGAVTPGTTSDIVFKLLGVF
jgi:hypothetical protein